MPDRKRQPPHEQDFFSRISRRRKSVGGEDCERSFLGEAFMNRLLGFEWIADE